MDTNWINKLTNEGIITLVSEGFARIQTDATEYVTFPTKNQRVVLNQPEIIIPLASSWVQEASADVDAFQVRAIENGLAIWCNGDHYHETDYDERPFGHGGYREGSGAKRKDPSIKKVQASWTLAPDIVAHIRKQPNQANYIESLVRKDI